MTGQPWGLARTEVLIHRIAAFIVLFAFLFLLRIVAWLAWPGGGFQGVELRGIPAAVQAGSLMPYAIDYCQPGGAGRDVTIQRELAGTGTNIQLLGLAHTTTGDCESLARAVGIPTYTPAGTYRLMITTDLDTNPLRHVRQVWLSRTFTVDAAPGAAK